ncbi:MAG: gamma-glutamyltransferase [Gaiellaceae bacterium]
MKGAIAAGHPATAEAGARVLAEGGNAVDAAVAACFASWTAESPLAGPGGGGFMLVHRARDNSTRLLDFFVSVPSGGADHAAMDAVEIEFDAETTQVFHIGPAAVAVPGTTAGLEAAHHRFGSLPWRELVAPGLDLAQAGVEVTPSQGYLNRILTPILQSRPDGKPIYDVAPGERLRVRGLPDTLAAIADDGARAIYQGPLARAICATAPQISRGDLAAYRVITRRPVTTAFRGSVFASNPPPASGGVLIAYGLGLLDAHGCFAPRDVIETMRAQDAAREGRFLRDLYRGGLARRLVVGAADAPSMTTHVSVVDAAGNAASLSVSLGSGSGLFAPGTGIHLNNMLGERDLAGVQKPGTRLTSMMAPSICFERGRPRLVVGSAGSARLRGAIMQVVVNVLARGLDLRDSVERPRLHLDGEVVHAEGGADVDGLESVTQWQRRNLYFGGANAVELRADGTLDAAGDPRRGGVGMVVQ